MYTAEQPVKMFNLTLYTNTTIILCMLSSVLWCANDVHRLVANNKLLLVLRRCWSGNRNCKNTSTSAIIQQTIFTRTSSQCDDHGKLSGNTETRNSKRATTAHRAVKRLIDWTTRASLIWVCEGQHWGTDNEGRWRTKYRRSAPVI